MEPAADNENLACATSGRFHLKATRDQATVTLSLFDTASHRRYQTILNAARGYHVPGEGTDAEKAGVVMQAISSHAISHVSDEIALGNDRFCKVTLQIDVGVRVEIPVLRQEGEMDDTARLTRMVEFLVARVDNLAKTMPPVGAVVSWPDKTDKLSDVWLPADGRTLLRGDFPDLFDAIGTRYGSSDAENFRLPDFRGYFLRGMDEIVEGRALIDKDFEGRTSACEGADDDKVGSTQKSATRMPRKPFVTSGAGKHSHDLPKVAGWKGGNEGGFVVNGNLYRGNGRDPHEGISEVGDHTHPIEGGDSETRPVNVAVHFVIRVK